MTGIIDWAHEWNKKADAMDCDVPVFIRAVYLDNELLGRDNYDVENDDEVNAISLYKLKADGLGADCVADIHDIGVAKEVLSGYLKSIEAKDDE